MGCRRQPHPDACFGLLYGDGGAPHHRGSLSRILRARVSCRMGGLTVATTAGVPESIMWMQSGHTQSMAARRYVRLTDPDRLYDTWRAFRL